VRGRGLTLGKFAPFHRGHQLVVETALAESDEVVVLVYDAPELTGVPLSVRAGWVRRLYPGVRVIEVRDGPRATGDDPALVRLHEECVLRALDGLAIDRFYSSEFYGAHVSRALGALDRRVDPSRARVPCSGTAVREDPYAMRAWLAPEVYRDLVVNVVLLGAPCTGKTTLAGRLAREFGTKWAPEYGREYWEERQIDRRLAPAQLVEIARGHLVREEALLLESDRFLFTDTNALTTLLFARSYHGSAPQELERLADACAARYDLVFVCGDDIPYDDTWDRSGEGDRAQMQGALLAELARRGTPRALLRGPLDARVAAVRRALALFTKFADPTAALAAAGA
jgi:HTH-type transcriptional repressor of NAD biosynthesis genes